MIYNCTPHAIVVRKDDGSETVFPPSGTVVRMSTTTEVVAQVDGVPVSRTTFGQPEGWPEEAQAGDVVIVSTLVAQHEESGHQKFAVVSPDTGPTAIRADGQIVAVRGFQTFREAKSLAWAARHAAQVAEASVYLISATAQYVSAAESDDSEAICTALEEIVWARKKYEDVLKED